MSNEIEASKRLLKHQELDIPKENPFANDLMERSSLAEALNRLVGNVEGSLVFSINGPWGTGKTTFLKMWNQNLCNAGYTTIYFSAWEDDYCEDALIALTGQIWTGIKDNDWSEMGETLKEIAVPLVKKIGFQILTKVASCFSSGTVDLQKEDLMSSLENLVEDYAKSTGNMKSLKQKLVNASEQCYTSTGKPLVIVVDELDRCRPRFAIELLEKIKHFFELPGIIFVLGVDREQLGHSIRCVYGQDMDVDGYLRRFIDLEFNLSFGGCLKSFIKHRLGLFGFDALHQYQHNDRNESNNVQDFIDYLCIFSKLFSLSFRDIETLIRTLAIGFCTKNVLTYSPLLLLMISLKLKDDPLYKKILKQEITAPEIIRYLVEKYNADKLFGYENGQRIGLKRGKELLIIELYGVSPDDWQRDVCEWIDQFIKRRPIDGEVASNKFPENLFHEYVTSHFYSHNDPNNPHDPYDNHRFLHDLLWQCRKPAKSEWLSSYIELCSFVQK